MVKVKLLNALIIILIILNIPLLSRENTDIVLNPKPNMLEKESIELKLQKTVFGDLDTNRVYLFSPFCLTCDSDGNIFIFDNLQSKVIRLNKNLKYINSFGRAGTGPSEFKKGTRGSNVYLSVNIDNKIYANDLNAKTIKIFTIDGHLFNSFRYDINSDLIPQHTFSAVGEDGKIYFLTRNNNNLNIKSQNGRVFFTINGIKSDFSFLFSKPSQKYLSYYKIYRRTYCFINNRRIYIYLRDSSVLISNPLNKGSDLTRIPLRPKHALEAYRIKIARIHNQSKMDGHLTLFQNLFIDMDTKKDFYLQFGFYDSQANQNILYKFSLDGSLLKTFHIVEDRNSFTIFYAKKSNNFYAIQNEKIKIYKEVFHEN
ncbi:MAG: hypothetical protein GF317_06725 [Candidatus Lokiarchaeota archaeon]|nr:hypothetical protein [Candidatus Lokiarchaeota archaeon]